MPFDPKVGLVAGMGCKQHVWKGPVKAGAAGWNRTSDPWLRRPILYPLSYSRAVWVLRKSGKDTGFRSGSPRSDRPRRVKLWRFVYNHGLVILS